MWLMTGILYPVDEIFRAISHPKHDMAQLVHGWAGLRAIPVARNGIYTAETGCLFLAESSANISHRFLQRAQRAQRLTARLTAL